MNDSITINLCDIISNNKMMLLRVDELAAEMARNIHADDVDDFLVFQAALRKTDIGSILLKADLGNDDEKNNAVSKAIEELKHLQIPYITSENIVKRIVLALGWDKAPESESEKIPAKDNASVNISNNITGTSPRQITADKKKILIGSAIIVILALGVFFGMRTMKNNEVTYDDKPMVQEKVVEKKEPEMTTNLSLGGLDLGLTAEEMHKRLGNENSTKTEGTFQYYYYDSLKVGIQNGKITSLVSDGSTAKTKLGIHEGSSLDDVVQAYGNNYMRMTYDSLVLYEYEYESLNGQKGILRFAINQSDNKVNYISVRIQEKPQAKAAPKEITVTYAGGKNSIFQLSDTVITMHVGQTLYLVPVDKNTEPNYLRIMTDGHPDKMGAFQPEHCVIIKPTGKLSSKGSSTEKKIIAHEPGQAVFTVVPNYGNWDAAIKMTINVVQ